MQFTTVRSKEKYYDINLKNLVRNTGSQPVGDRKKCFPAIWKWKKLVPSYFEPDKHCCSYLEREKCGSQLFGDQKIQFITVRRKQWIHNCQETKEKDYDIYLKSEKLVHSQQEHEKNVSQLIGSGKNWFLAIWSLTNTFEAFFLREKSGSLLFGDQKIQFTTVRSKEKDYDIYLKSEKLFKVRKTGSQPVGARKKCFPTIWKSKKLVPSYFEPDKHCCSYLVIEKCGVEKTGSQ